MVLFAPGGAHHHGDGVFRLVEPLSGVHDRVFKIKIAGFVLMALAGPRVAARVPPDLAALPFPVGVGVLRATRRCAATCMVVGHYGGNSSFIDRGIRTEYLQGGNTMSSARWFPSCTAPSTGEDAINVYSAGEDRHGREGEERLIHLASDEVGHMTKLEKHLISVLRGRTGDRARGPGRAMSEQVRSVVLEKVDAKKLPRPTRYGSSRSRSTGRSRRTGLLEMRDAREDSAKEMFLSLAKERSCTRRSCGRGGRDRQNGSGATCRIHDGAVGRDRVAREVKRSSRKRCSGSNTSCG